MLPSNIRRLALSAQVFLLEKHSTCSSGTLIKPSRTTDRFEKCDSETLLQETMRCINCHVPTGGEDGK